MIMRRILCSPIRFTRWILGLDEKVELILDNCPPGFDLTEAGKVPVEKIERSIRAMRKINKVEESST
jgi:hypothetical protein